MLAEADVIFGAGYGERSPERVNSVATGCRLSGKEVSMAAHSPLPPSEMTSNGERRPRSFRSSKKLAEGCTHRICASSSGYAGLPRSSGWAVRSPSCSSAGSLTSSDSARRPTRRTSRSPCSDTNWPCYVVKWHVLGTRRPIAPCWPRSPVFSVAIAGASSWSVASHGWCK